MFGDMAVYTDKLTAAEMNKFTAAEAFQMKMLAAFLFVFDVLIARACFAVYHEFTHASRFNEAVELAVNGSSSDGSAFGTQICAIS